MKAKEKKKKEKLDLPHMEICRDCALKRGAHGGSVWHGVTMWVASCPYCLRVATLCSIRDYDWPDGRKAWFD